MQRQSRRFHKARENSLNLGLLKAAHRALFSHLCCTYTFLNLWRQVSAVPRNCQWFCSFCHTVNQEQEKPLEIVLDLGLIPGQNLFFLGWAKVMGDWKMFCIHGSIGINHDIKGMQCTLYKDMWWLIYCAYLSVHVFVHLDYTYSIQNTHVHKYHHKYVCFFMYITYKCMINV